MTTLFVGERLGLYGWGGIVLLAAGVLLLSLRGGRDLAKLDRRAVGFALFTAVTICAYSVVDGIGARLPVPARPTPIRSRCSSASRRWWWSMRWRGADRRLSGDGAHWKTGLAGGALAVISYSIAIWAMTVAPIAIVAALRETSVLFGALIAVLFLKEPLRPAASLRRHDRLRAGAAAAPRIARDVAVAPGERRGLGAEAIGKPQPPHQQDGAERAVPSQRRPEVVTRAARHSGRPTRLRRLRQRDVLHQRRVGKAAGRGERLARHEHRLVAGGDAGRAASASSSCRPRRGSSGLRPAIRTSKRPHCRPDRAGLTSISMSASGGSAVSACRNSSTSPAAAAAPAFICAARPRGAAITRSASGRASSTVPSRLPPSATITSAPRARNGASACSVRRCRRLRRAPGR